MFKGPSLGIYLLDPARCSETQRVNTQNKWNISNSTYEAALVCNGGKFN